MNRTNLAAAASRIWFAAVSSDRGDASRLSGAPSVVMLSFTDEPFDTAMLEKRIRLATAIADDLEQLG